MLSKIFVRAAMSFAVLAGVLSVSAAMPDDELAPDVTARVARISFFEGDAQLKRSDGSDWESVRKNLPVVEGDEIASGPNTRLEIQLDLYTHLRIGENSVVRIVTLGEQGIALSLPQGSLIVRASRLDPNRQFIEIDAPQTTVAVQKEGTYRINAANSSVRIDATDGAEARIYSTNSGFTIKNGRSASMYVSGDRVGEWEMSDASRFADDLSRWSLDRDLAIAEMVKKANFNEYYDDEIYGAEELSDNGEWIHTKKYGYVWRPFASATRSYSNWTPYRYGEWRWISPFGWTWVNDEPWGWATSHYGRWIYDAGYWYWTPYGYYRASRSWWYPALVVMSVYNNNICWYPLPYYSTYYNYNYYYGGWGRPRPRPRPRPTPHNNQPQQPNGQGTIGRPVQPLPPDQKPPAGSVTSTAITTFNMSKEYRPAPAQTAKAVISRTELPDEPVRVLPTSSDSRKIMASDTRVAKPAILIADTPVRTGAAPRVDAKPLDAQLQRSKMYGDRPTVKRPMDQPMTVGGEAPTRSTGAVERPVIRTPDPVRVPQNTTPRSEPVRVPQPTQKYEPVRVPQNTTPRSEPVRVPQPTQKYEPVRVPQNTTPRYEPVRVPQNNTSRPEPVRVPQNTTPRSEPVRTPPSTSKPASDSKPAPSASQKGKG